MAKWYMTVGYPGGEFAWKQDEDGAYPLIMGCYTWPKSKDEPNLFSIPPHYVRPCPPDLAEWLDTEVPVHADGSRAHANLDYPGRWKVPGGWLVNRYAEWPGENGAFGGIALASCFIPVAGAAGITILEDPSEAQ